MRKINYNLLLLLFFIALIQGCELTDDGSYSEPVTLYEKINGVWTLTSIKQIDEIAKVNAVKPDEMVLTSMFEFNSFSIALNVDVSMQPTTYEVRGNAPELFSRNGYWELDKPFTRADGNANKIRLYSDEAKTMLTDELIITTIPAKTKVLEFKLVRYDGTIPYVSYVFKCKPAN